MAPSNKVWAYVQAWWAWAYAATLEQLRRLWKVCLRTLTHTCELERILRAGAPDMTQQFTAYVKRSKQLRPIAVLLLEPQRAPQDEAELAFRILSLKHMDTHTRARAHTGTSAPDFHSKVLPNLRSCIHTVLSASEITAAIDALAATPVDRSNAEHESRVMRVWERLGAHTRKYAAAGSYAGSTGASGAGGREAAPPAPTGRDWGEIGFQGKDPTTDFRGAGLYGLVCIEHFAVAHTAAAAHTLARTDMPFSGYPLAITIINVADFMRTLLKEMPAQAVLAQLTPSGMRDATPVAKVLEAVAQLQLRFDAAWWAARTTSVMDFPRVFGAFKDEVRAELANGRFMPVPGASLARSVSSGV